MKCPYVIKVCTKCKRILVANEINFSKQKDGKWNLHSSCKQCKKKYDEKYRKNNKEKIKKGKRKHYEENKKEILEKHKQYREEHKEEIREKNKIWHENNKESKKESDRKYRENNKEKIQKDKKRQYVENKEKIKKRAKEYNKNNPHIKFNSHVKRRCLEETQGKGITKEQWLEMMNFFEWKCAYSGIVLGKNNRSVDHIMPLDKGGENEIWNLVPMLINYNSSKHTKDMEAWYIEQEFFDIDRLLKIYEWIEYAWNKWNKINN